MTDVDDMLDLYAAERDLMKARQRLVALEKRNCDFGAWDDVKEHIDAASGLVVRYRDLFEPQPTTAVLPCVCRAVETRAMVR